MCIVVDEVAAGEGDDLVRALRRHGMPRVVVLARRAHDEDVLALLAGGVRGVVLVAASVHPEPDVYPVRVPIDGLSDLTDREIDVLRRVADGHSNGEIGAELGLSALTVKSHLARIARKVGTGDRAQLVAIAIRAALFE